MSDTIRTDNSQTLANALARIAELENTIAEIGASHDWEQAAKELYKAERDELMAACLPFTHAFAPNGRPDYEPDAPLTRLLDQNTILPNGDLTCGDFRRLYEIVARIKAGKQAKE